MMQFFTQVKENYRQAIEVSNVTDIWTNQMCRRIAAVIVIIINPTPITPNIVTVVSFAVNMVANYQLLNNQLGIAALLYFFQLCVGLCRWTVSPFTGYCL